MSMALADIVPHGDFEYEENDDGTITITGYTGTSGSVQIPIQIDGKPVTAIGDGAFEGCEELVSVYLNGVEHIGEDAFKGCAKLAGVNQINTASALPK